MHSFELSYKSSIINYCKAGNGQKLLFCFHGYSQSSQAFSFIEKKIANDFTLIAIDLPFHGKTVWNEGLNFTKDDLLEILVKIRQDQSLNQKKIYLLGFSMGGRVSLSLLQEIPEQIEKIILVAPDGMKENFWYWLATHNQCGNKFFKHTMEKPHIMFRFLRIGNKMGVVNQSIYKFINYYIFDKQVRSELYRRWTTMRHFRPDIRKIKSIIKEKKILVGLLYGKHDRVIRYERARKFIQGIESCCQLKIIPAGHLLLTHENTDTIISLLKD
ncbi:MAG TPA: alpha/beta hydrolase [Puia sp.]|nr:alpha/beta hydrolase [Puia sp.]